MNKFVTLHSKKAICPRVSAVQLSRHAWRRPALFKQTYKITDRYQIWPSCQRW